MILPFDGFVDAIKADPDLQNRLRHADLVTTAAMAATAGFEPPPELLQRAAAELSEAELDGIAGGNAPAGGADPPECNTQPMRHDANP